MSDIVNKWGNQLERSSWILVFFGMMTQVSTEYAFPSYNAVLGFWGAHCAFTCHGRSTFGLLSFTLLGIILDFVFFLANNVDSPMFQFQIVMLVFAFLSKCYILFCGSHYFAAIGGENAMEHPRSRDRDNHVANARNTFNRKTPDKYGHGRSADNSGAYVEVHNSDEQHQPPY